jgi:hypothetical protein
MCVWPSPGQVPLALIVIILIIRIIGEGKYEEPVLGFEKLVWDINTPDHGNSRSLIH